MKVPGDDIARTQQQTQQNPLLKRESLSSQALQTLPSTSSSSPSLHSRKTSSPMAQPPAYSPPMGSYSPGSCIMSSGSSSSSCSTKTSVSAVEPSATLPMIFPYLSSQLSSQSLRPPSPLQQQQQQQQLRPQQTLPQMEFLTPASRSAGTSPMYTIGTSQAPRISSSPSPLLNSSPNLCSLSVAPTEPDPNSSSDDPAYDVVMKDGMVTDSRTTLYIKNIPHRVNPSSFLTVMMSICPNGFVFLYLPNSKQNPRSNNGYAFVKLRSTESVSAIMSALDYKTWPHYNKDKICEVKYAKVQSFNDLLHQFYSSNLLSDPDRWRPFIIYHGEYTQLTSEILAEIHPSEEEGDKSSKPIVTSIVSSNFIVPQQK